MEGKIRVSTFFLTSRAVWRNLERCSGRWAREGAAGQADGRGVLSARRAQRYLMSPQTGCEPLQDHGTPTTRG